jgi:DNA polymerase III epsilon subunit-like protein
MATREIAMRPLTRNTRWVVIDIETTPSDDGQQVVSIGINQWRTDATTEQPTPGPVEWFVDPGVIIENTRVHHITARTLTDNRAEPFAFYINGLNTISTGSTPS